MYACFKTVNVIYPKRKQKNLKTKFHLGLAFSGVPTISRAEWGTQGMLPGISSFLYKKSVKFKIGMDVVEYTIHGYYAG